MMIGGGDGYGLPANLFIGARRMQQDWKFEEEGEEEDFGGAPGHTSLLPFVFITVAVCSCV